MTGSPVPNANAGTRSGSRTPRMQSGSVRRREISSEPTGISRSSMVAHKRRQAPAIRSLRLGAGDVGEAMVTELRGRALRVARLTSFVLLVAFCIVYGSTLGFVSLASGRPHASLYIWFAMIISSAVYFRWPWCAALVSWAEMCRVLWNTPPWVMQSLSSLCLQLGLNFLLLISTHVGLLSTVMLKRTHLQRRVM